MTHEEIKQLMAESVAVNAEDVARAKQFVLGEHESNVSDIAERWLQEHQLNLRSVVDDTGDEARETVLRLARSYGLRMALYQAVWELITSGLVVPLGPAEEWKPNLNYRNRHGAGGVDVGGISYPYVTKIRRVVPADRVPPDTDVFLQGIPVKTLHAGIREAIGQALECFRRGLYMPATVMLAAGVEGAWTECGRAVARRLGMSKFEELVNEPLTGFGRIVSETHKALGDGSARDLLKAADRRLADVNEAVTWTTVLRERRNALHWGKGRGFIADHASAAGLLMGAPIHLGTLEAIRATC